MIAVLDTNYIIAREIPQVPLTAAYVTSSVDAELRDKLSMEYRQTHSFLLTVRDPMEHYVEAVLQKTRNSMLFLSPTDVDVIALTLEISDEIAADWISQGNVDSLETVKCLTRDNGMRNALNSLGLLHEELQEKKFKMRCYACMKMYDEPVDFCNACGYATVTRVTVVETEEGERVMLSKHYVPKEKEMKMKGVKIVAADQKEYQQYLKRNERMARNQAKTNFFE